MPIQFDPKNLQSQPDNLPSKSPLPSCKSMASTFFRRWLNSVYQGLLKEKMAPEGYCKRAWSIQTGTPASEAPTEFWEPCIRECIDYKHFCEGSNKN